MDAIRYGFNGTIKTNSGVHIHKPKSIYHGQSTHSNYGWSGRFK
jgi:hypothetical protein